MAASPKIYYTPEDYLALERAAEYKSEYLAGEIFAMAGAGEAHNTIAAHIVRLLDTQFLGGPCRVYVSDMRVQVAPTGLYTYPDVVAVCGPREYTDAHRDTLLNPTVIFEVLSPSTEAYDRGKNFGHYRRVESLQEYVLVAQDEVHIEHYSRQDGVWVLSETSAMDDRLHLPALDATLPLAAIYENVELAPNPTETTGPA